MRSAAIGALLLGAGLLGAPAIANAADATAEAAADSNTGAAAVGEVMVTATRREEKLSEVPIAVTAASGETIKTAHIGNFADLPTLVPGVTFVSTKGQSTANIQIRGQATGDDAPALEVPVAIFMDDIYYGTLASFDADFFDLDQIAILRGPQGTTFGRNVVGGALQITSNRPQLGVTNGEANLTVETYGRHGSNGAEANGFFNLPLGEKAAARLGYSLKDVDGYMYNVVTGHNLSDQKSFSLRPSIRWEPTDDLRFDALLQYSHENQFASGYARFGQGIEIANEKAISSNIWDVFQDVDGTNRRDIWAAQVKGNWHQAYGDWLAISSYRTLDAFYEDDGDNTPYALNKPSINASREFQFSEELRLTSPSGQRLEYVGGLYYSFENLKKSITFGFDGTNPISRLSAFTGGTRQDAVVSQVAHVINVAPYAEFKFHFSDQLALTLGGRYMVETKHVSTDHSALTWAYGAPYNVHPSKRWSAFTPRAILDFKPTDGVLLYGSVSTGFKGGGWSMTATSATAAVIPLEPEKSTSYELGAKLQLFDHRLSLNVAAYQADTKNLQVRTLKDGVLRASNAGQLRVKGVEVESVLSPFQGLQVGANYAYTDAYYASFVDCTAAHLDCTGDAREFVPKNDLKLFATYRADLGETGFLTFHLDDQWSSRFPVSAIRGVQPIGRANTGHHGFLNGSIMYEPANAHWRLQVWGKNLGNKWSMPAPSNYNFYFLRPAPADPGSLEADRGIINPPRQVGVTFSYRFE
ncbi:MAG TPA: TonB-dependent receptor [Caulobacteraceae bacterium]|nr:TonB-dependent receptor [Caulobacteraceae bacterium]